MASVPTSCLLTLPVDATIDDLKRTVWEDNPALHAFNGKLSYKDLRVWKLHGDVSAEPGSSDALQRCEAMTQRQRGKGLSPTARVSQYWSTEHDPSVERVDFHIRFTKEAMRKAGLDEPFDMPDFWPSVSDFPKSEYGRPFHLKYDVTRMTHRTRLAFLFWDPDDASESSSSNDEDVVKNMVVVKFSTRYGIDAHEALAHHGLAPRIRFFGHLPPYYDSLYFVVMDAINPARGVPSPSTLITIQDDVAKAVDLLHRANMVHGDIRTANIILHRPEAVSIDTLFAGEIRAMLLDFDWAGVEGQARYPAGINTKEIWWAGGVEPNGLVLKDHDTQMIEWLEWDELLEGIRPLAENDIPKSDVVTSRL